jgi:NitT/TauT family transport system permease protein
MSDDGEKGDATRPPSDIAEKTDTGSRTAPLIATGGEALSVGDRGPRQQSRPHNALQALLGVFAPNRVVSGTTMRFIALVEVVIALVVWLTSPFKVLPRPDEVLHALSDLWMKQGLGQDLAVSFGLNLQALALASLISLALAYLTVLPVFRPIVTAISKGRFLSLAGFTFVFTLMLGGGRPVKISLLVFAVTVFYVTSMVAVVAAVPKEAFDHARTLRMSEWRVVWEVVILGTADRAFEVLRQNAAIGWMMLTMVEGIVRGEGGIGVALLDQNKHFNLADIFAVQLVILIVGLVQDYAIGIARQIVCPYADLTLERK